MITTTDPIADLLTRIRNAYSARKDIVNVAHSNVKMSILKVMKDRRFIYDYKEVKNDGFPEIEISLHNNIHHLNLKRISKPGQRIYIRSAMVKKVNGGLGVAILSTPKGILSGEEARKMNVGGELLCEIF